MRFFEKYGKSYSLGLQSAMEYRANFLLSLLTAVWPIFIQTFLWTAIFKNSGNSVVLGYTFGQILTYTVMAQLVSRLVKTGFEYEVNDDVKSGGLNKFIVKPVGYFGYRLSSFLGQKSAQLLVMLVFLAGAMVILGVVLHASFTLIGTSAFFLSLLFAFALNFAVFFCVSMLAFWLTEIGFLFEAVRIVFIALSGGIFPLDIFGKDIQKILSYLPFKYTVNFPVEVLNGKIPPDGIILGFGIQIFWILVVSVLALFLWRAGAKRYVAVGG